VPYQPLDRRRQPAGGEFVLKATPLQDWRPRQGLQAESGALRSPPAEVGGEHRVQPRLRQLDPARPHHDVDRAESRLELQVDPDRVLLLDVAYTNNSRTLTPRAGEASLKWSLKWMVWLQDLMLTYGFFV